MSLNKEGFKMDPKLAETIARIKAEHPVPVANAANDPIASSEQTAPTAIKGKKKYIDPDAMAHDLYHRMRQTDP